MQLVTSEGKDVDRNYIITVLYNLACCYQRNGSLEDCVSYLDGAIFNLSEKVTSFDDSNNTADRLAEEDGQ